MDLSEMKIAAPTRGNRKLEAFFEAANADDRLKGLWHMQQVTADRLGMSDHSWVHIRIVLNIALRIFRLLTRSGVEPAMVSDHGVGRRDAEVVIAAGCLLHDAGMSIHRTDHEEYSLFLAADLLPSLFEGIYQDPELTVVASEVLHTIIGHRRRGNPTTIEAGVVRVADAAIDDVAIEPGTDRAVQIEIAMNNSAGIFQVDELLATKLRGSGLEEHVEVVARIEAEHEKRLVPVFRI
jgi:metal-dependent HD superfamily phosphatase/phosphodiesterase